MLDDIRSQSGLTLVDQNGSGGIYQMRDATGDGTMTFCDLFPGVTLIYSDFHMESCESGFTTALDLFCVDYCREGRMEYPNRENTYSYVEAGDLKLDRRLEHQGHFSFPLSHYHGVTISFELPRAAASIGEEMRAFPVDLCALRDKFCAGRFPQVIHGAPSIEHIFHELYAVPDKIRRPYCKLKVLELLLYLDALELPSDEKPYFYRSQVEKVKAAEKLMRSDLERRYTLEELSARFQIPQTALKACFKSVFGSPVNAYMRQTRVNAAALALRTERDKSVAEIGGRMGYDSASKFAAAFKAVKGKTPQEYRNE